MGEMENEIDQEDDIDLYLAVFLPIMDNTSFTPHQYSLRPLLLKQVSKGIPTPPPELIA